MFEVKTTEYTFEIRKKVSVTVYGTDTEDNYEKAMKDAIRQVRTEIDHDWISNVTAEEYTDYEYEETI